MRRRELIAQTGITVLASPWAGQAQTSTGLPLVGVMMPAPDTAAARRRLGEITKGLQEVGLIEGTHYSLAARFAAGDLSRWPSHAQELGALNARVIISVGYPAPRLHDLLPNTPIVFTGNALDPVKTGAVQSYAHPGGMITGNVLNALGGEETIAQKRIGLFKQIFPNLKRIGILASDGSLGTIEKEAFQKVADRLGFEVMHYVVRTLDDLEGAFASGQRDNVDAFYISGEPLLLINMPRVMALVQASGKPTVGSYPEWGRAGLLMSYSTDLADGFRRAGVYAAKILKGAAPGDLPIEQASKFIMVINQKTARTLGIVIPPTVLAIADEVIE
jgi:putative ABC transport system substrate-binding protein